MVMMIVGRTKYLTLRSLSKTCFLHRSFNCTPLFFKPNIIEGTSATKTAGIIVIGDEILKGQVQDTNSHFVSKIFYEMGIKVNRISVIADSKAEIAKEVRQFSSMFTYVITTGGIGPTHDDLTFEAIAQAFEEPVVPHPVIMKICSEFYKTNDLYSPAMKLAHVPKSAKLTFGFDKERKKMLFPCVSVKNVYIFPGVPHLMQGLFTAVCGKLFGGGTARFHMKELYLTHDESKIANHLNEIVSEFPQVIFGSYPNYFHSHYKVRITVESLEEHVMLRAYKSLRVKLPSSSIIEFDNNPLENSYNKILCLVEQQKIRDLQTSIEMLTDCCKKHKSTEICVYFDGKIESTAVLHLYYACMCQVNSESKIHALCVKDSKISPSMETYIRDTTEKYHVNFELHQEPSVSAIKHYILKHPETQVLITGSSSVANEWKKCSESESEKVTILQPFAMWSKADVWTFVNTLCLLHCSVRDSM